MSGHPITAGRNGRATVNGTGWRRVSAADPCPVCGKPDNCTVSPDGGHVYCGRVESVRQNAGGQWLHDLRDQAMGTDAASYVHPGHLRKPNGKPAEAVEQADWDAKARRLARGADAKRRELAAELGVSAESLEKLGVGHGDIGGECWTVPERDADWRIIGINRRFPDGTKRSVGKRGLTFASGWREGNGPILIVEGGSCTAALLTMELAGIGRPSNCGGVATLVELLRDIPPERPIYVVGENDAKVDGTWPGLDGAKSVARQLAKALGRPVSCLLPPADHKDTREFLQSQPADADRVEVGRLFLAALEPVDVAEPQDTPPKVEPHTPFPVHALPEPVRGLVKAGAKAIGCNVAYLATAALVITAAAIGNTRVLRLKRSWFAPAILWAAIIGDSGSKKSTPIRLVTAFPREREERAVEKYDKELAKYEDECVRYEKELAEWRRSKDGGDPPEKPTRPTAARSLLKDTTMEAVAPLLKENPRGLVVAVDELVSFFGGMDRYAANGRAKGDVGHWLSMYNGENVVIDRKTGKPPTIFVPRASVWILGGVQPGVFQRAMGTDNRENGLLARFLVTCPPKATVQWTEADIAEEVEDAYAGLLDKLYKLEPDLDVVTVKGQDGRDGREREQPRQRPHALRLTPTAKGLWVKFYNEHAAEQAALTGDLAAAWSKLEEIPARIALVVHCVRLAHGKDAPANPDEVDERSLAAGIEIARWYGREAHRVYAMFNETEAQREHRENADLVARLGGVVSPAELMRSSRRFKTSNEAEHALMELAKAGYGRWESVTHGGGRGRPTRRFRLNDPMPVVENTPKPRADGISNYADTLEESRHTDMRRVEPGADVGPRDSDAAGPIQPMNGWPDFNPAGSLDPDADEEWEDA